MRLIKIMVCLLLLLGAVGVCSSACTPPPWSMSEKFIEQSPFGRGNDGMSPIPDWLDEYNTPAAKTWDEIFYRDTWDEIYSVSQDEVSQAKKYRVNVIVDKKNEKSYQHKSAGHIIEEEIIKSNNNNVGVYVEGPYDYTIVVSGEGSDVKATIYDVKNGKVVGSEDVSGVGDTHFKLPESSRAGPGWRHHGDTPTTIKLHYLGKTVADRFRIEDHAALQPPES